MTNVPDIAGKSLDADPAETREWLDAFDAHLAPGVYARA